MKANRTCLSISDALYSLKLANFISFFCSFYQTISSTLSENTGSSCSLNLNFNCASKSLWSYTFYAKDIVLKSKLVLASMLLLLGLDGIELYYLKFITVDCLVNCRLKLGMRLQIWSLVLFMLDWSSKIVLGHNKHLQRGSFKTMISSYVCPKMLRSFCLAD